MRIEKVIGIAIAVIVSLWALPASATHLHGGAIVYKVPDPQNAPTTVQIDVLMQQVSNMGGGSDILQFGDGTNAPFPQSVLVSQGAMAGEIARFTFTHTYPAAGEYTVSYMSCCLPSQIENSGDSFLKLQAKLDVTSGNTAGPLSYMKPFVQLATNGVRSFFVPAKDPDGAPVSCRFSTTDESGIEVNPPLSAPAGQIPTVVSSANPPGCVITWDLNGTPAGKRYAMGLVIESFNGANSTSTPVQMLIETVLAPPPECASNGVVQAEIGVPVNANFTGKNMSGGPNLSLGLVSWSGALAPNPGTMGASPLTSMIQWTPGPADVGLHLMQIVYRDQVAAEGACSMFIDVAPCPQYGTPCSAGVGACLQNGIMQCNGGNVACSVVPGMPSTETCNAVDDDCDGVVDNGCAGAGGAGGMSAGGAGGMGGGGAGGMNVSENTSSSSAGNAPNSLQNEGKSTGCACSSAASGTNTTAVNALMIAAAMMLRRRRAKIKTSA